MRKQAVSCICLTLFLLTAGFLPAVDFGGNLDNATAFGKSDTAYLDQQDKLSAWFNTGTENNLVFSIAGSYTFSLEYKDAVAAPTHLLDIDDLRLYGTYPAGKQDSTVSFELGRYKLSDPTGYILNHKVDGFSVSAGYPSAKVHASFGYTGLYFMPSSTIYLSRADINAAQNENLKLATPRLIGAFQLDLPQVLARQTLNLAFLFQEDLRGLAEIEEMPASAVVLDEGETTEYPNRGGKVDTQYTVLNISGPVTGGLYYNTFFSLGTGRELSYTDGAYSYNPVLSFLTGLDIKYYLEGFLYSKISAGFVLASGDSDKTGYYEGNTAGKSAMFLPVSESTIAQIFNPRLGNIAAASLSYSLKPLSFSSNEMMNNFQTVLSGVMFFRTTEGPISEGGLAAATAAKYLGTEIDLSIRFRPFADLGIASSTALFIPSSAFDSTYGTARFEEKIEFSFSF